MAAISNTQLIATAAKKHEQYFSLETLDPQIGQPSSNLIARYDCLERARLPLTLDHHHEHNMRYQQRDTYPPPSPTLSSSDPDLSIRSPPPDQMMDFDVPPPYSLSIEPSSSSSSSSNPNIPHHLAWLQNITLSLCIDQECFRAVFPTFKLVGYTKPTPPVHAPRAGMQKLHTGDDTNDTSITQSSALMDPDPATNLDVGMAEFMPLKREGFVFHHSALDTPPCIRRLSVDGDESRDYLSKHALLSIKSNGGSQIYAVRGSEVRRGSGGEDRSEGGLGSSLVRLEWRFEYTVEDKRKADGTKATNGEKFLTPLRFSCSPGLLHPKQGRKVTVLSVWKKIIQPKLFADKVEPPATSPTTPGYQKYSLAGSASPLTSPKGVGIGPLRFPTTTKLWGNRARSSPYRFDKGSEGSEEDLIPSEDSANRTRRPRSASTFVSRVSQEPERSLQWWDEGQSSDAVRLAGRDARPATASGERSRGRNKTQSLGRGAVSEGENERVPSRSSQGGSSTPRSVYSKRPRTAR